MLRSKFVTLLVVGMMGLIGPLAAPAAAVGGGSFECQAQLPSWPGSSQSVCYGQARGVFQEGSTTLVCTPFCSFEMSLNMSGAECVAGEPPLVAIFNGTITISSGLQTVDANYAATLVGTTLTLTTSSPTGAGKAILLPVSVPVPTCAAPGPLTIYAAGGLTFV